MRNHTSKKIDICHKMLFLSFFIKFCYLDESIFYWALIWIRGVFFGVEELWITNDSKKQTFLPWIAVLFHFSMCITIYNPNLQFGCKLESLSLSLYVYLFVFLYVCRREIKREICWESFSSKQELVHLNHHSRSLFKLCCFLGIQRGSGGPQQVHR